MVSLAVRLRVRCASTQRISAQYDPRALLARAVKASREHSAAPQRVHNFNPIAFMQHSHRVLAPRHDFTIDLDCDATRAEAGVFEQGRDGHVVVEFVVLAIEQDPHLRIVTCKNKGARISGRLVY